MNEDFAALADLVGQLLAARWLEEQDEPQLEDQPDGRQSSPTSATGIPPRHVAGD